MKSILGGSLALGLIIALAACSVTPAPPTQSPPTVSYPSGGTSTYPGPGAANCTVPPFRFSETPLAAGSTLVSGTGPAKIPIVIASITFMGKQLGAGVIGPDGKFSIGVTALVANDFVGISLGDLAGTGIDQKPFLDDRCYQGPGAMLVPQVGFFYDTALVK